MNRDSAPLRPITPTGYRRRRLLTASPLAVVALLVVACNGSRGETAPAPQTPTASATVSPTPSGKPGGTLRIVGTQDPSGDPGWADSEAAISLVRMVSRQLYSYPADPDPTRATTPVPDIAARLPATTDGGKTYTVQLRSTVSWDVPQLRRVTATDVARGIKRLCTPPRASPERGYFAATVSGFAAYCAGLSRTRASGVRSYIENRNIPGVEVVGDDTVVFRLLKKSNDFTSILALPAGSPVPLEALDDPPDSPAYRAHLISDGPYRFSEPTPGESYRLARNPAWDPTSDPLRGAYVDHVALMLGRTADQAQEQLERGQADLSWDTTVPTDQVAGLRARRDGRLSLDGAPSVVTLAYGVRGPAAASLRTPALRRALASCIRRGDLLPALGGSFVAQPAYHLLLPGIDGYPKRQREPVTGPSVCRSQLVRLGHGGDLALVLLSEDTPPGEALAAGLSAALSAAGVHVTPLLEPSGAYQRSLADPREQGWDLAVVPPYRPAWFGPAGRAIFQPLLDPRWTGPRPVDGGLASSAVSRAVDTALAATDPTQVAKLWAALDTAVLNDAPRVPLATVRAPHFHGGNIRDWLPLPSLPGGDPTNVSLSVA